MDKPIIEMYFFLAVTIVMSIYFGYLASLAWFRPKKFAELYKNSPFVIRTKSIEDWTESNGYLWLGRIITTTGAVISSLLFVITILGIVQNYVFRLYK